MFISKLVIENYRNFSKFEMNLKKSTVIIGENNVGKTNLLNALGLIFSNEISFFKKRMLEIDDLNYAAVRKFKEQVADNSFSVSNIEFPVVRIRVIMEDFTPDQEAVVGDWFIDRDLKQAQLSYIFSKRKDLTEWVQEQRGKIAGLAKARDESSQSFKERQIERIDFPLRYYDYSILGGLDETRRVEQYFLKMLRMEFLDALRDARLELMASGDYRLLFKVLSNRDENRFEDIKEALVKLQEVMGKNPELEKVKLEISRYLEKVSLESDEKDNTVKFQFSRVEESEILKKISLMYGNEPVNVERNGLGRNNLLYISLVLSHLTSKSKGENNVFFRLIGLEEPEAHLHPQLQEHLAKNIEAESNRALQLLITSHSPHIASKLDLENTVVLYKEASVGDIKQHYILGGFKRDAEGRLTPDDKRTVHYLQKYLDATKSTMFFSRRVILVEGISEQILVPKFFELCSGKTLGKIGCSLVNVGGVAFKHFLEIVKRGYFIKCAVLTDRDANTRKGYRADHLKDRYDDNKLIRVEITLDSTFEKDVIEANKEKGRRMFLFEALERTKPSVAKDLCRETGEQAIDVSLFFAAIEDSKSEFAFNLLAVLNERKKAEECFNVPAYIQRAFDFIRP